MTKEEAIRLRAAIEKAAESLDDKTASTAPHMFRRLTGSGEAVQAGTRVNWGCQIKKASVTLWDREDQGPDHAPELWADLDYVDGIRKIPDVITVEQAFALDELGWRGGVVYRSLQNGNGWLPENAPALWEQINETYSGTADDPIPYSGNMTLVNGLYYTQDGTVYLCIRDTGTPVYNALSDLVGLYVEVI